MEPKKTEPTRPTGNHAPGERPQSDRPIPELLRELIQESRELAKGEVDLVRTEVEELVHKAQAGIMSMAGGAVVLSAGLIVLLFAVVFGLSQVMQLWVAALLVGITTVVIGGIMAGAGKRTLKPENLKPNRTLDEVRETRQFVAKETTR
ncbi:MAG: phage holin family protein [Myxococcales bacterium]|nr:phage holin family protein [Myxococcales bacterium]